MTLTCAGLLIALHAGIASPDQLVRATSACFEAVYVLVLAAATRLLRGPLLAAATTALALAGVIAVFSAAYLLVPSVVALASLAASHRTAGQLDPLTTTREGGT
jgi:amino acid efflux transporter